jgi:hypothetical protein
MIIRPMLALTAAALAGEYLVVGSVSDGRRDEARLTFPDPAQNPTPPRRKQ